MSKFEIAAKRLGGFVKKNAFYLLVALCIASVVTVITLAVLLNQAGSVEIPGGITDIPADIGNGGDVPVVDNPVIDNPVVDNPVVDNPVVDNPIVDNPVVDNPVVEPLTFALPINGTVSKEYSDSALVFNQTLAQWSTHDGLDFAAENGTTVSAAAKGVVKETGYDELNGWYVIVTHDEGYESGYYSLGETIAVSAGQSLEKGASIGVVSDSMASESLDGAHLHFTLSKNGESMNPLEVLVLEEK